MLSRTRREDSFAQPENADSPMLRKVDGYTIVESSVKPSQKLAGIN